MGQEDKWLSITEAARILEVSRSTLYRMSKKGYITLYKMPGLDRSRVKREELDKLMRQIKPLYQKNE